MANRAVRPLDLRHTAAFIARNYRDKGAVVITFGNEGARIGMEDLTPERASGGSLHCNPLLVCL